MPKPFTMFYGFVVFIFFYSFSSRPLFVSCPLARSMFHLKPSALASLPLLFLLSTLYIIVCVCVVSCEICGGMCMYNYCVGKIFIRFRYYYRLCSCTRCEFVFVVHKSHSSFQKRFIAIQSILSLYSQPNIVFNR